MTITRGCCFDLRTGTHIMAWFGVVVSLIGIIICSYLLNDDYQRYRSRLIAKIYLGSFIITLFTSSSLVIAVLQNKKYFLLPYLVVNGIAIFLAIFMQLYVFYKHGASTLEISRDFLGDIFSIYYWCVVRAYYMSFGKNENENETIPYTSFSTTPSNHNKTGATNTTSSQHPTYADIEKLSDI